MGIHDYPNYLNEYWSLLKGVKMSVGKLVGTHKRNGVSLSLKIGYLNKFNIHI